MAAHTPDASFDYQMLRIVTRLWKCHAIQSSFAMAVASTDVDRIQKATAELQENLLAIGDEIDVSAYKGKENDEDALFELRDQVAFAIQDQISELLTVRENDKNKGVIRKLLTSL